MKRYGLKSILNNVVILTIVGLLFLGLNYYYDFMGETNPLTMFSPLIIFLLFQSNLILLNQTSITFWYLLPFRKNKTIFFTEIDAIKIRCHDSENKSEQIEIFLKNGKKFSLETSGAKFELQKLKKELREKNLRVKSYNLRNWAIWDKDYYIDEDPDESS